MKQSLLRRRSGLRYKSNKPHKVEAEERLRQAQDKARSWWGERCIVPGCQLRRRTAWHHAYGRGSHPERREDPTNLFPCCQGRGGHHRMADTPGTWAHTALREAADECAAAQAGRRPYLGINEVHDIIIRHMRAAEEGTRHGSTS